MLSKVNPNIHIIPKGKVIEKPLEMVKEETPIIKINVKNKKIKYDENVTPVRRSERLKRKKNDIL